MCAVTNETLKQIKLLNNQEDCKKQFTALCEKHLQQYPNFIRGLLDDKDNYFAFKLLPSDVQKHFYTTNIVGMPGEAWLSKQVGFLSGQGLAIHPEPSVAV
jgi:hypothetical protein